MNDKCNIQNTKAERPISVIMERMYFLEETGRELESSIQRLETILIRLRGNVPVCSTPSPEVAISHPENIFEQLDYAKDMFHSMTSQLRDITNELDQAL